MPNYLLDTVPEQPEVIHCCEVQTSIWCAIYSSRMTKIPLTLKVAWNGSTIETLDNFKNCMSCALWQIKPNTIKYLSTPKMKNVYIQNSGHPCGHDKFYKLHSDSVAGSPQHTSLQSTKNNDILQHTLGTDKHQCSIHLEAHCCHNKGFAAHFLWWSNADQESDKQTIRMIRSWTLWQLYGIVRWNFLY